MHNKHSTEKKSQSLASPKTSSKSDKQSIEQSKKMREHKTQEELDKTLADSFPASDPPSSY